MIQRDIVHGRVDDVKTEYSRDVVPIAPELATELLDYRDGCYPTEQGWLFANPATDRPCHQEEIQNYRSWLDQTDAPIGVQGELMRHASIQTTMNVYGRAMTDSRRQAHNNVVQMILHASRKEELDNKQQEGIVNVV